MWQVNLQPTLDWLIDWLGAYHRGSLWISGRALYISQSCWCEPPSSGLLSRGTRLPSELSRESSLNRLTPFPGSRWEMLWLTDRLPQTEISTVQRDAFPDNQYQQCRTAGEAADPPSAQWINAAAGLARRWLAAKFIQTSLFCWRSLVGVLLKFWVWSQNVQLRL